MRFQKGYMLLFQLCCPHSYRHSLIGADIISRIHNEQPLIGNSHCVGIGFNSVGRRAHRLAADDGE